MVCFRGWRTEVVGRLEPRPTPRKHHKEPKTRKKPYCTIERNTVPQSLSEPGHVSDLGAWLQLMIWQNFRISIFSNEFLMKSLLLPPTHTHTHTHTHTLLSLTRCTQVSLELYSLKPNVIEPLRVSRKLKGRLLQELGPAHLSPSDLCHQPACYHTHPTPDNHVAGFQMFPSHFTCNDVPFWPIIPSWHPFLPSCFSTSRKGSTHTHTHTHTLQSEPRGRACVTKGQDTV